MSKKIIADRKYNFKFLNEFNIRGSKVSMHVIPKTYQLNDLKYDLLG